MLPCFLSLTPNLRLSSSLIPTIIFRTSTSQRKSTMFNPSQRPSLPIRPDREPLSKGGSIAPQQQPQPQIPKQQQPRQNQQPQNQRRQAQPQKPRYQFKPLTRSEVPFRTPKNQYSLFRRDVAFTNYNAHLERADPARMAALNALTDTELWMKLVRKRMSGDDQAWYEWLEAVRNRPGLWKRKTGCEFGFMKDSSDETGKLKGCVVC